MISDRMVGSHLAVVVFFRQVEHLSEGAMRSVPIRGKSVSSKAPECMPTARRRCRAAHLISERTITPANGTGSSQVRSAPTPEKEASTVLRSSIKAFCAGSRSTLQYDLGKPSTCSPM